MTDNGKKQIEHNNKKENTHMKNNNLCFLDVLRPRSQMIVTLFDFIGSLTGLRLVKIYVSKLPVKPQPPMIMKLENTHTISNPMKLSLRFFFPLSLSLSPVSFF